MQVIILFARKLILIFNKVPDRLLDESLTIRYFSGGGRQSTYNLPLNNEQAIENKDALAKVCSDNLDWVTTVNLPILEQALYSALFDFLVKRINQALISTNKAQTRFIGVLDIVRS